MRKAGRPVPSPRRRDAGALATAGLSIAAMKLANETASGRPGSMPGSTASGR